MKKLATLVGSAVLLAVTIVPALAAGNNCENSTTGPLSNNTCTIINKDKVIVNNVNDAQIVNKVSTNANTGYNSASMNTLGGSITTGNATSNVTVGNVANINTTNVTAGLSANGGNNGSNSITGPMSNNTIWLENKQRVEINNSNTATVFNKVDVDSNTGYNAANTNTGPASVTTGDARLGLRVDTHVNDNYNLIQGSAGGGSNTAENMTTGPLSNNTVSIFNKYKAIVNNVNDLQVKNFVDAEANTGYNEAKTNTLGGSIDTGDSDAGVGVDTEGNINTTRVAMAMGGFDNNGSNSITGPGGEGPDPSIYIENTRKVEVNNLNNKCESHNADDRFGGRDHHHRGYGEYGTYGDDEHDDDKEECDVNDLGVFNFVESVSDSGNNAANTNTGGGGVVAGFAGLIEQVLTHLNDTLTEIL